jgi:hypothetical protein
MKRFIVILVLMLLLFLSCDPPYSDIVVVNNTSGTILVEWEANDLRDFIKVGSSPAKVEKNSRTWLVAAYTDVISKLGYGDINSIDNVVMAIDQVFTKLNVYTYENSDKKLLYSKNYFLDSQNIRITQHDVLLVITK